MGGAGFSAAGAAGSGASEGANSGSKANSTSGGRNQPVIQSDPRQNAIIVRDLRERIPIYEKLIAFLDQPTALIEIEALIVDVNDTKVDELGVDWLAGRDGRSVGFGTPMTLEPDRSMLQVTRNVNPVTLVIDSGNFLIGKIKVLESTGDARLLSRPSILTLDNMGATIDLSTTFYVRVVGERVAEVVPVTASTTLRVTPRYVEKNGKRLIQLVIDIEDGSLQDSEQIGQLPTVVRSSVNTEAVVGENQSLLIGGYKIDSDISQNDGLPLISKIPIVGAFFRHARKETQRRERLFLITPKIIALATEVAPATVLSLPPERPNPAAPWKN
jgi:type III secretion protein C